MWFVVFAALTAGLLVSLFLGRARSFEKGVLDVRLHANVLAVGVLVIVLVALAFVAGFAALDKRWDYILIAGSVLGIGLVLYSDTTGSRASSARCSTSALSLERGGRVREDDELPPALEIELPVTFEYSFASSADDQSAEVLAAAARAEASFAEEPTLASSPTHDSGSSSDGDVRRGIDSSAGRLGRRRRS